MTRKKAAKKKPTPRQKPKQKETNVNIDSMTFGELKQIAALFGAAQPATCRCPMLAIGKAYLIQTATGFWMTGRVKADNEDHYVLGKAAWIADTGRFHQAVKLSEFNEVELLAADLILTKQAVVMATEIEKDQEASK
jgi:hypothetical protein